MPASDSAGSPLASMFVDESERDGDIARSAGSLARLSCGAAGLAPMAIFLLDVMLDNPARGGPELGSGQWLGFMAMKTEILEDDKRRSEAMRDRLPDRFYQFELIFFDSCIEIIRYMKKHAKGIIGLYLEHDLISQLDDAGVTYDPGTGRDVADYLATVHPLFPVIIQSTNEFGALGMDVD